MLPEPLPDAPREGRSYSGRMSGADLDMRIQGPKHYIQRPTLSPSTRMSHLVTRNALPIYRAKCCKLPIRFSPILGQITEQKDSSASTLNLKFFGQGLQGREAGRTLGWGKSSPHQSPLDRHLRHPDNRPRLSRQKARTSLAQGVIPPAHWPSIGGNGRCVLLQPSNISSRTSPLRWDHLLQAGQTKDTTSSNCTGKFYPSTFYPRRHSDHARMMQPVPLCSTGCFKASTPG
jgi:hypothetical protein